MISAVILAADSPAKLQATFASLAGAASDGFVREVIVVADNPAVAEAADEAGARCASDRAAAFDAARQPWVLALTAGARLEVGWEKAARRHMHEHAGRAGWFRLSLRGGLGARLKEAGADLAARIGQPSPAQGLLAPKAGAAGRRPIAARILV
jgi:hypothetical protein